ncbi:MAG: glycosyltransferase family 4 protein [Isosphaeraceae bacterium]
MHLALNFQRVDPSRGGAETYVADLCRRLIGAGHRVDLYAESWADGCLPDQVNLVPVAGPGRTRMERIWSFARNSEAALSQARYDCSVGFVNTWGHDVLIPQGGVHAGSLHSNARRFASPLARGLYLLFKTANPKYWVYRAIEERQYSPKRQTRVVAVSNLVKKHLQDYHHLASQQIRVVPNAIDLKRVMVSQPGAVRCAFRNRLGLAPGDLVGLFVGHNFALKGLKPLLLALGARRKADHAGRPIHLVISGGGEARPYQRLANQLGLRDLTHFVGFYPDIRACYSSSDFFVQPTYYDPCSLVVLEALACGLPVITTAQNGASELMADGREGYILTAPDAAGELVAALGHMTSDRKRREMASQAGRLGQAQTFDAHVARLTAIFEEVACGKSRHTPHSQKRSSKSHTPHGDHSRKARR